MPAPRPQHHLPSATYRGSYSSLGRGRSSSERSVRPTVPLKGAGKHQPAFKESRGDRIYSQRPRHLPQRPEPYVVSPSIFFRMSCRRKGA